VIPSAFTIVSKGKEADHSSENFPADDKADSEPETANNQE
jgi:hypothetical protein